MYTEGHVEVRVDDHVVVIDRTRRLVEVRRSAHAPTPDDTVLGLYHFGGVTRVEMFLARDGSHRLVLGIGSREGIDLGEDSTQAQGLRRGREVARLFGICLDIEAGSYLDCYFRENGPVLSRVDAHRDLIEAKLVDPDPFEDLSPWLNDGSDVSGPKDVSFNELESTSLTMDNLLIDLEAEAAYDDGPYALPRVRTAPEVEAVCPLEEPMEVPPMRPEAEAHVRANHRPPRQLRFRRRSGLDWLRAALKGALGA